MCATGIVLMRNIFQHRCYVISLTYAQITERDVL